MMDGFPDFPNFDAKKNAGFDGAPLEIVRLQPIGPANIPPRRWAYGRFLLFGTAAVLGAVDGGGKGAIATVIALAVITGQPLLGERVWRTGPVVIVTYEDDETEWHRRIAAACLHYGLDYDLVLSQIHFLHKPGRRVSFGRMVDGNMQFPDSDAIRDKLAEAGAVLLIVDPFNHAHSLDDGNNNVLVAKVAAEMTYIARDAGVAVLVLHHLRKGSTGNPDDLMGATSLRATFRCCRILARMDSQLAKQMNILDPWRYSCIAGSKENFAPPPEKASWFRLVSVDLGNTAVDPLYPEGDNVAVATAWQPRKLFEGMDAPTLRAVFDCLKDVSHSPHRQSKRAPWVGAPLVAIGGRSDREATQIVAAWMKEAVLSKTEAYDPETKNKVDRAVLNEAKAAAILADMEMMNVPTE